MERANTSTPTAAIFFGDYVFRDTWIIVTDSNGCDVQVTQDELIPSEVPIIESQHVKVQHMGQEYWIPKELHFPM